MEKVMKNQNRFQYGQVTENSKNIQRVGMNKISPINASHKTVTKETVTPEISKVQQIFSKVTDTFKIRHEGTQKLQNEVGNKEVQLHFLEKQIKEQIENTAKQSATYSILNHQVKELAQEIDKLNIEVPDHIHKNKDELSKIASKSKDIFDQLINDANILIVRIDRKIFEYDNYSLKIINYFEECDKKNGRLNELKNEIDNLRDILKKNDGEIASFQTDINDIDEIINLNLADIKLKAIELEEIKLSLNNTENQLKDEASENSIAIDKLKSETDELDKELSNEELRESDMMEVITGLEEEVGSLNKRLEALVTNLEHSERDENEKNEKIESNSKLLEVNIERGNSSSETLSSNKSKNEELERQLFESVKEKTKLKDDVENINQENNNAYLLTASLMQKLKELNGEVPILSINLSKANKDLENYLMQLQNKLIARELDCTTLSTRIEMMEKESFESEKAVKLDEQRIQELTTSLALKTTEIDKLKAVGLELAVTEMELTKKKMSLSTLVESYRMIKLEITHVKDACDKLKEDQIPLDVQLDLLKLQTLNASKEISEISEFPTEFITEVEIELTEKKQIIDLEFVGPRQVEIKNTQDIIDRLDAALPQKIALNEEKNNKLRQEISSLKSVLESLIAEEKVHVGRKAKQVKVQPVMNQVETMQFDDDDDNNSDDDSEEDKSDYDSEEEEEVQYSKKQITIKTDLETKRQITYHQNSNILESHNNHKRKYNDMKPALFTKPTTTTTTTTTMQSYQDERSDNCSTTNFEDTLFGDKKPSLNLKKQITSTVGKAKLPHQTDVVVVPTIAEKKMKISQFGYNYNTSSQQSSKPISSGRVSNTVILPPKISKETKVTNIVKNTKVTGNSYSLKKKSTKASPGDWFDEDEPFL